MNTKNPLLMVAVGFAVVGFAFYHFGLQPKQKDAKAAKAQVSEAQDKLDTARALLASNQQARTTFRSAYAKVVRLGKAVPGDDDVRSLVVQLDRAAASTHIDFQSIQIGDPSGSTSSATAAAAGAGATLPPGATIGPAGFPIMPFSFSFRGGFFRLGKFFERLDAFVKTSNDKLSVTGRLLTVDGLKLEPDTTGFPNIKATVKATSYLVSPLEGPTGGATAAGPAGAAPATGAEPGAADSSAPATTTATIR